MYTVHRLQYVYKRCAHVVSGGRWLLVVETVVLICSILDVQKGPDLIVSFRFQVIVSRMRYMASQTEKPLRIIGLSTSVANAKEIGEWLGATNNSMFHVLFDVACSVGANNGQRSRSSYTKPFTLLAVGCFHRCTCKTLSVNSSEGGTRATAFLFLLDRGAGIYSFYPNVRPVRLEIRIQGFDINHFAARQLAMVKPAFQAINQHSPGGQLVDHIDVCKEDRNRGNCEEGCRDSLQMLPSPTMLAHISFVCCL